MNEITDSNKNAFEWDAYRPLQWPSRGGGVCLSRGVYPRGVSAYRGVCPGGVHTPPCPLHAEVHPPWTELLTYTCENITFPRPLLRAVKMCLAKPVTCSVPSLRVFKLTYLILEHSFWSQNVCKDVFSHMRINCAQGIIQ